MSNEIRVPYKVHVSEVFGRDVVVYDSDKYSACEYVEGLCNCAEIDITSRDAFGSRNVEVIGIATEEEIRNLDEYRKNGKSLIKDKSRKMGDYRVLHRLEIGRAVISVGINEGAAYGMKYVVANDREGQHYNKDTLIYTNEESIAMAAYGDFIADEAKAMQVEEQNKIQRETITEEQCVPFDEDTVLFGKVVVLRPYKPTFMSDWQICIVVGGNHWLLRCAKISDGHRMNIQREEIMGILKPECYPDWVTEKLKCITEGKQRRTDFIEVEGE